MLIVFQAYAKTLSDIGRRARLGWGRYSMFRQHTPLLLVSLTVYGEQTCNLATLVMGEPRPSGPSRWQPNLGVRFNSFPFSGKNLLGRLRDQLCVNKRYDLSCFGRGTPGYRCLIVIRRPAEISYIP